ncbi:Calcipressin [Phanerochaete sordida]|uniref:Calcipressin n=1 Tax=Phanerochaete sordida TaxID=48140 RepID=A0A9P3G2X3_9APHY|nr:Calcipressin [Phanerochaete sordida]
MTIRSHSRNSSLSSLTPASPARSSSSLPTADSSRTNTLAVTQIPRAFFEPVVLDALRQYFDGFGEIHTWAPLTAFGRILVVYYDEEAVELAKEGSDGLFIDTGGLLPGVTIRVYRADPTPLEQLDSRNLLRPPQLEKNFLISPPGSPPVGWEQIREDPPNNAPLADDLISALKRLQVEREGPVVIETENDEGITIFVEDCDGGDDPSSESSSEDDESEWVYGQTRRQYKPTPAALPPPTSLPPLPVH